MAAGNRSCFLKFSLLCHVLGFLTLIVATLTPYWTTVNNQIIGKNLTHHGIFVNYYLNGDRVGVVDMNVFDKCEFFQCVTSNSVRILHFWNVFQFFDLF